jgi:hypothetical protein
VARGFATPKAHRACLAALAAIVLVLFTGASASEASAVPAEYYGMNIQRLFYLPSDRWDPHLREISASGTGLVRRDATWWAAEPNPPTSGVHSYRWSEFDVYVRAMAARGLRWYPVMAFSTPWASLNGDEKSRPRRVEDYTAYVSAFAARYGRGGAFWRENPTVPQLPVTTYEIWNEQNSPYFWSPQADAPERYADLYLAARSALKGIDPQARVVVGGLTNPQRSPYTWDAEFVRRMYRHRPDAHGNVDAIGFHPYSSSLAGVYAEIRRMRLALRAMGEGAVPLEITEIGWSTTTASGEWTRAGALGRLVRELPRSDCNVSRLIPYTWITAERDRANKEDWFGIYNQDATPKLSGAVFSAAVRQMTGRGAEPPPTGSVVICAPPPPPRPAPPRPRPPVRRPLQLWTNVGGSLRRGLDVGASCSDPCKVRVELLERRGRRRTRRLAIRRLRSPAHRHRVRIAGRRLRRARAGRVRLQLRAFAPSGQAVVLRRVRQR